MMSRGMWGFEDPAKFQGVKSVKFCQPLNQQVDRDFFSKFHVFRKAKVFRSNLIVFVLIKHVSWCSTCQLCSTANLVCIENFVIMASVISLTTTASFSEFFLFNLCPASTQMSSFSTNGDCWWFSVVKSGKFAENLIALRRILLSIIASIVLIYSNPYAGEKLAESVLQQQ